MPDRSPAAIDAELARHVDEQARIADALVELERHPGHRLLRSAALTGVTAARWAQVRQSLPALWADLAAHRAVVAQACALRTGLPRPGRPEWAQLHELLVTRPAGSAPAATLPELVARLDGGVRDVASVLDDVEAVHLAALAGLGPLAERLRDAQLRAGALIEPGDPDLAVLAALATAVDAQLATCTNDPLSHPARLPRDLVGSLERDLDRRLGPVETRLAGLAALRDGWAGRRHAVAGAVADLDALHEREARARRAALDRVVDTGLAAPPDPRPALRRRLVALADRQPGAADLTALGTLAADVDAAADALRAAVGRATGLTDRRDELAGRFAAYRAKALRLGVSDDPEVVASAAEVARLLAAPRTDLRGLTPAVVTYQQRVNGVEGRTA